MPLSGDWRVSYSLTSDVACGVNIPCAEENLLYIYINGNRLFETMFSTKSYYTQYSTGGREWILEARAGDTIWLGALQLEGEIERIIFCVNLLNTQSNSGVIPKTLIGQGEGELVV